MAGAYEGTVKISGPLGAGMAVIPLKTGQNTQASGGGFSLLSLLPWLIGLLLAVFVFYRVRKTGQRPNLRAVFNRQVLGGLILVSVMLAVSVYAVSNFRRKGAMTPIEAQVMEMNMPAPSGAAPVELASVERGTVENTVRYTGQAVANVEQDVYPRVTGSITWMPFYAGDRVKEGQLLARLDTSQIAPQVAERRAMVEGARQGVSVARTQYEEALAAVAQAKAELGGKEGALAGAKADLTAAREERISAEAQLSAMESQVADAEAELEAARADQEYWQGQIKRSGALLKEGAISGEEFQREKAEAQGAVSKVRQAQARVRQAKSQVRAAEAALRKADAAITAASAKVQETASDLEAHHAHVRATRAAASTARRQIGQAQAGAEQARAALSGVTTTQGYTEIRSLVDGVVTERLISPGVLVNPGQAILKVAQISPIRLQANVAEADLRRIEVGSPVTVRDQDGRGKPVAAKVTSIAPAVDPAARTGVVEAVLPNPREEFLPGEYVTMEITTGRREGTLNVPSRAVQERSTPSGGVLSADSQSYVWVAEPVAGRENQFTVRLVPVETGMKSGNTVEIRSGLHEGQQVVVSGYEYLSSGDTVAAVGGASSSTHEASGKAMPGMEGMSGAPEKKDPSPPMKSEEVHSANVAVTEQGYEPASVTLKQGTPARITFVRRTDKTCGTEVVFPEYGIKKELPLGKPVVVELTPKRTGELTFTCGMDMLRGKVVVR
jgi:RND family efflux transporter MFP subunit